MQPQKRSLLDPHCMMNECGQARAQEAVGQLEQVLAEHHDVLEGRQLQGGRSDDALQDLPGTLYGLQVRPRWASCDLSKLSCGSWKLAAGVCIGQRMAPVLGPALNDPSLQDCLLGPALNRAHGCRTACWAWLRV